MLCFILDVFTLKLPAFIKAEKMKLDGEIRNRRLPAGLCGIINLRNSRYIFFLITTLNLYHPSHQLPFVQLYRIFKSQVKGITYQRMADAYFIQPGDMLFQKF